VKQVLLVLLACQLCGYGLSMSEFSLYFFVFVFYVYYFKLPTASVECRQDDAGKAKSILF
jgi:hypothetical protein